MILDIRKVTPDDLPDLIAIEKQSFFRPHWDTESFLRYNCIVAEIRDRIAGFLVSRETFGGGYDALPEREILNLAVAKPYRRIGIASLLLKRAMRRRAVYFLEVRESNIAARALYRKIGFVQVGTRARYYEFPSERAIVMQMKKC
ncbi:MAG TPA: GNAT family N-acetyltransferase [Chthoniobacterales bacterium]|nr:GNAT family N-acetyltransferase [Chthoniobacterales bacterium]